ncbi:MAG: DNA gyrase subunit A, partial [Pseudomonadota bacterium]|nr:DNA gyrase subunit A [Pseudomonadota bacterium]
PLIQGQGNFGNIDGDNAAAMRYTESRLTRVSELIMDKINDGTTKFIRNYDETEYEPTVFPSYVPNLLANGSSGIAVGMATNIPSHNIIEILEMAKLLIDDEDIESDALMKNFNGPDLPTGGLIVSTKEEIHEIYQKGRGSLKIRCKWEEVKVNNSYVIKITEIPFGIQKSKLIEKLADCILSKTIKNIADVRDESDENVCIIIKPKKASIPPLQIMGNLYKFTDLEVNLSINMNVLQGGEGKIPRVLSLREIIIQWLDHRHQILIKSNEFYLERAEKKIHNLEGYLIVYMNIDQVISIIRNSDTPKADLISEFDISEGQAESILEMKLRSLRKLEEISLKNDLKKFKKQRKEIKEILISPSIQKLRMLEEINVLKNLFTEDKNLSSMARRLTQIQAPSDIELENCDEEFSVTVFLTEKGWIRTVEGHIVDENAIKLKDQDKLMCTAKITTEKKLLIFTNIGKVYSIYANKLKINNNDFEPIRKYLNLTQDEYILHVNEYSLDGPDLILISKEGKGMISKQVEMLTSTRNGKLVMNLVRGISLCAVRQVSGSHIAVISDSGNLLVFSHKDIKRLSRGSGIIFQNLKNGTIIDITSANPNEVINLVNKNTSRSIIKIDASDYIGERGRIGKSLKLRNSSNIPLLRFFK